MRCCGRISCLRILHLSKLQKRELQRKQLVSAMRFDSLPDNNRTSPDVCFVTNLRLSHHTKLQTAAPHLSISNTGLPAALIGFVKSTGTRTLQRNQMGALALIDPSPNSPFFFLVEPRYIGGMLWRRGRPLNAPAAFIHPCQPIVAKQPPTGPGGAHEPP
jgi:hypothetical protein